MASWFESYVRTEKAYVNPTAATVGATAGIAVADLGQVPVGYIWRLIRYSVFSNSAGSPIFELFTANSIRSWQSAGWAPDRTTRQDYTPNGKNNVADNSSPPVFMPSEVPLFVWSGGSNGDVCAAYAQIAIFEMTPVLSRRNHLALSHQEDIEDQERANATVVGGSGWNMGMVDPADDLVQAGYSPWAGRDPADAADNPGQYTQLPDGMGQYVGGNDLGAQKPKPPFDGRILPDGSTDSAS